MNLLAVVHRVISTHATLPALTAHPEQPPMVHCSVLQPYYFRAHPEQPPTVHCSVLQPFYCIFHPKTERIV